MLGPFANNGGSTQTTSLKAGRPAIDASDDTTCAAMPAMKLDQRWVSLPQGVYCDNGAFEARFFNFEISLAGDSIGAVDGNGIDCSTNSGSDCSKTLIAGSQINLTTTADAG